MGPAVVSYRFEHLPSAFRYFPRAVFGRRHALVPEGQRRAAARRQRRTSAREPRGALARYRRTLRLRDDGCLPVTYPHVLAMPLQFAILTHPRFVVRIMGLIHVANEIRQARPLPADATTGSRAGSRVTAKRIAGTSSTSSRR